MIDRERLAKLLELTASDFDGEALAALRKASAMVKASGLTWTKLLVEESSSSFFGVRASGFRSEPWQPYGEPPEHPNCRSNTDFEFEFEFEFDGKGMGKKFTPNEHFTVVELLGMIVILLESKLVEAPAKARFCEMRAKLDREIMLHPDEIKLLIKVYTIVTR